MLYVIGVDHIDYPELRGFNIAGGVQVVPELVALWAGLSIYASAFIAEIVRAAILSVHKGQREAALSLGLRPRQVLSKVVLPQALRVMIPPMTSQYLNIIKSSSLGAAVAYPELFQIFAGTVLQQTAREIETMFMLMAIFLSINLAASALMNWYNRRVALVGDERRDRRASACRSARTSSRARRGAVRSTGSPEPVRLPVQHAC